MEEELSFRQPERIFFNPYNVNEIWVTSFGNGMWMGNIALTGINEVKKENEITVFPNPGDNYFTLISNVADIGSKAVIYNTIGQNVKEFMITDAQTNLDLSDQPIGIYYIKYGDKSVKIIKTKK